SVCLSDAAQRSPFPQTNNPYPEQRFLVALPPRVFGRWLAQREEKPPSACPRPSRRIFEGDPLEYPTVLPAVLRVPHLVQLSSREPKMLLPKDAHLNCVRSLNEQMNGLA